MSNGLRPIKNVLSREQERPRQRPKKSLSRLYPSHQQRMASHTHRVAVDLAGLKEPSDSEATYIDPGVDIPAKAVDTLRLRTFQMAYKHGVEILDPTERFARAIVASSKPIRDGDALRRWYEKIQLPRQKPRKASCGDNPAAQSQVQDVTHACV